MWIAATVAHYLAADEKSLLPVALLGLLAVSYVTRPANRRGLAKSMLARGDGSTPLPASGRTSTLNQPRRFETARLIRRRGPLDSSTMMRRSCSVTSPERRAVLRMFSMPLKIRPSASGSPRSSSRSRI